MNVEHAAELQAGDRFAFGANWARFLAGLTEQRIHSARASLQAMLRIDTLAGKTFLDIGSGSGLFSLVARQLGARVHSFDYDPQSVACTNELKRRYFPNDPLWVVEEGSALDRAYLATLGTFDVVYSWGVLHHTGGMYEAFDSITPTVAPSGMLFIAIYNHQGWLSKYWKFVKRQFNKNAFNRTALTLIHLPYLFVVRYVVRALTGRLALNRGMSLWHDMIDWLGGYPFEVAKPEDILRYFRGRGFILEELKTCGGRMGCNEFVFRRPSPERGGV